jgi:hypothetical protein
MIPCAGAKSSIVFNTSSAKNMDNPFEQIVKWQLAWQKAIENITPYVVKILTPYGSGTGFMISHGKNKNICGIATAAHVVDQAHFWEQPIRLIHQESGQSILLRSNQRAIVIEDNLDSAAIIFNREQSPLPLPTENLELIQEGRFLKMGNELGWLGFPALLNTNNLCFFSGRVSCWLAPDRAYLVDGVAINGVSGGPVIHYGLDDVIRVIGIVSAYIPNRATGESQPGLSVVRDVTQFQLLIPSLKTLDEAKEEETPHTVPPKPQDKIVEPQPHTPSQSTIDHGAGDQKEEETPHTAPPKPQDKIVEPQPHTPSQSTIDHGVGDQPDEKTALEQDSAES